jgi:hypothetical protein
MNYRTGFSQRNIFGLYLVCFSFQSRPVRRLTWSQFGMKMAVFCDFAPCTKDMLANVSEDCTACIIALLMEVVSYSETSVNMYRNTERNIPENSDIDILFLENRKSLSIWYGYPQPLTSIWEVSSTPLLTLPAHLPVVFFFTFHVACSDSELIFLFWILCVYGTTLSPESWIITRLIHTHDNAIQESSGFEPMISVFGEPRLHVT